MSDEAGCLSLGMPMRMRTGTRLLIGCLLVFGLLSVTDFTQTFALISTSNGEVYESNPVADAWLERHGWEGLAIFKLATVVVFVAAAVLVTRRRPNTGVAIAAMGCAALLAVTNYSHGLLQAQPAQPVLTMPSERLWTSADYEAGPMQLDVSPPSQRALTPEPE